MLRNLLAHVILVSITHKERFIESCEGSWTCVGPLLLLLSVFRDLLAHVIHVSMGEITWGIFVESCVRVLDTY